MERYELCMESPKNSNRSSLTMSETSNSPKTKAKSPKTSQLDESNVNFGKTKFYNKRNSSSPVDIESISICKN